jgi:hypothetical protein
MITLGRDARGRGVSECAAGTKSQRGNEGGADSELEVKSLGSHAATVDGAANGSLMAA